MQLKNIKEKAIPILKRNHVIKAGIFGSYATGRQTRHSDVDILVKFEGKRNLLDVVKLKRELERKFKKKVDIITYTSIHKPIKKKIMSEEKRIL